MTAAHLIRRFLGCVIVLSLLVNVAKGLGTDPYEVLRTPQINQPSWNHAMFAPVPRFSPTHVSSRYPWLPPGLVEPCIVAPAITSPVTPPNSWPSNPGIITNSAYGTHRPQSGFYVSAYPNARACGMRYPVRSSLSGAFSVHTAPFIPGRARS